MSAIYAVVFDFDDTLAPDTTSSFIGSLGVDVGDFWEKTNARIRLEHWDPIPVYLYQMLELSRNGGEKTRITRDKLAEFGRQVSFHNGVTRLFGHLRKHVEEQDPDARLEFYLLSSGIGEILRHTRIAGNFKEIWACEYLYGDRGEIVFPKNVVSFTEKTRFLFQISKGQIGEEARANPFMVNERVQDGFRIPFANMIYVGDGYTDIPCFSVVRRGGGEAFGVYDMERESKRAKAWGFVRDKRVTQLLPADFGAKSALLDQLKMALTEMVRRNA